MRSSLFKLSILALLMVLAACTKERMVHLKIFQTSDIHGAIFPYDFTEDKPTKTSMASVYSYVEAAKKVSGAKVILLDNGDNLQGQPAVYYYNFIKTDGTHLQADVMNFMHYDAASVGNHDIEAGHAVYDKIAKEYAFPLLAANAVDAKTGKPYFTPYTIVEREGIKVAVLGMTNPHIPSWLPKNLWSGMTFEQVAESAQKWVDYIQENEHPHLIVGLFHVGYGDESNNEENPGLYVAQHVSGIDILFLGHDHTRLAATKIVNNKGNSVIVLNPSNAAQFLSEVDVTFTLKGKKVLSKKMDGRLLDVSNYPPDSLFLRQFSAAFDAIKAFVAMPIGKFTKTISSRDAYFGPSAFIDLIHRVQLDVGEADISFTAPLAFESEIKVGQVYVADMFKLYRFENMLYTMTLSGKEVKDYLEYSYAAWINTMKSSEDHLLLFQEQNKSNRRDNFIVPLYNFDSAAGIIYEVDATKPAGSKIKILSMADKKPFSESKIYRVAVNSYRGNGGGGHLEEGAGIAPADFEKRIVQSTDLDLRYYLMKWIEREQVVNPTPLNQWKIVPETWTKTASKRDYEILFGEK